MLFVFNLLFVIIAIAMIILVLMQRGAGASAGSGFGGGASATVFGARGSSNFLSKATKWLAISFFSITLFMAWYAMHRANPNALDMDLGVMGAQQQAPAAPAAPQGDAAVPAAPAASGAVPQAPADAATVPSAPAQDPAPQAPQSE
ncbi:preprotein translocase subunit SecG [Luteimonas sp. S4-F44]|uniref:preprotein translocase subunit SecG n=1 Tax=Luteimonas sp. S4-F44 TaxID=2925842 RepID=UPI001F52D9EC|nr:preprotein translocase subunit SecG [Luteimonas sp. S4-F44]UNK43649.1 preprotein translocase subunit SecG [Luteimonas sp. S4-F44]